MKSVLHDWVNNLPLRHQGVLVTGIRGCDGVAKHDLSKPVMRAIRFLVLVNYDFRETSEPKGFTHWDPVAFVDGVKVLAKNLDEYPVHFVFHMIHALEVIGYTLPPIEHAFNQEPDYLWAFKSHGSTFIHDIGLYGDDVAAIFEWAYKKLVSKFHVNPETRDQLDERLHEDRVANGTTAG